MIFLLLCKTGVSQVQPGAAICTFFYPHLYDTIRLTVCTNRTYGFGTESAEVYIPYTDWYELTTITTHRPKV